MRLVRLALGGIVLGAVAGYVAELLRPRSIHRNPAADVSVDPVPLPENLGDPAAELGVPDPVEVRR